jgi:hypothetical protein
VIVELNAAVEFNATYSLPGSDIYADLAVALGLSSAALGPQPREPEPATSGLR